MACCKCCCGGVNCTEGQVGRCCCGGPSGTCCQAGEYCCSGACQSEPCGECADDGDCPEPSYGPCQPDQNGNCHQTVTTYTCVDGFCVASSSSQSCECPTGCCCYPDNTTGVTTQYLCDAAGGTWHAGSSCVPSPCDGGGGGGSGACCVCTNGWSNSYIGDRSFETEEEVNAWIGVLEDITAAATQSLADNGYECIYSSPPQSPYFLEEFQLWHTNGIGSHGGACCGVIDYNGTPANDGDNYTIYPCIQDEVTRSCVDGVSAAECAENCGGVFHSGQTCASDPCAGNCRTCSSDADCVYCSPGYDKLGPVTDDFWNDRYVCCPEGETYNSETGICSGEEYSATSAFYEYCDNGCCQPFP